MDSYPMLHHVVQNHISLSHLEPEQTLVTLAQILGDCGVTLRQHGFDLSDYPRHCAGWIAQRGAQACPFVWPGDWEAEDPEGHYRLYGALATLLTEAGEAGMDMAEGINVTLQLTADVVHGLEDVEGLSQGIVEGIACYLATH